MHWLPAQLQVAVVAEREEDAGGEEEVAKASVAEPAAQDAPRPATERISRLANVVRLV